jgi:hypothetical protein
MVLGYKLYEQLTFVILLLHLSNVLIKYLRRMIMPDKNKQNPYNNPNRNPQEPKRPEDKNLDRSTKGYGHGREEEEIRNNPSRETERSKGKKW